MRAGTIDRIITILRLTRAKNDFGEVIETWEPVARVWANVRESSANERWVIQQLVGQIDTVFMVRNRIDVRDRIRYCGREYDVLGAIEIGRREGFAVNARARSEGV